MTQTSFPFDGEDTTEGQYSQLFRRLQSTGVAGVPGGADLAVTADSSGMTVKVAPGFAIVRGHAYDNSAQETLTIPAASTNPRRDLVVLRLDPSANSITLAVKGGTAGTSPSDPALTQTDEDVFEIALARIDVPANAVTITSSNVTDQRRFIGAPFGRWQSALRPSSPAIGDAGFNTSINRAEVFTGPSTGWRQIPFANDPVTAEQITASEQLLLNAGRINGSRIFVQATAPTSPQLNDIHLWG
jgi:hypothetical protein